MLRHGNSLGLASHLSFSHIMKPFLTLLLLVLLAPRAQAAQRIGKAEVREGANGVPCFTISEQEEKRSGTPDFQAINVSDSHGKPMWQMAMPRERTFPVSHGMCIPYAGRVQALPQTPAAVLQEGRVYQVVIETRKANNAGAPRRYVARFCFTPAVHAAGSRSHAVSMPSDCTAQRRPFQER